MEFRTFFPPRSYKRRSWCLERVRLIDYPLRTADDLPTGICIDDVDPVAFRIGKVPVPLTFGAFCHGGAFEDLPAAVARRAVGFMLYHDQGSEIFLSIDLFELERHGGDGRCSIRPKLRIFKQIFSRILLLSH